MSLYDDLQDKLDNVHVYSTYFMAECVFHKWESHTQSLMVHEDGFKCLSCGKYGSLEYLSRKVGTVFHVRSDSVSQILPKWRRWEQQYGDIIQIAKTAHRFLLNYPQFGGFFRKRGIEQFIDIGFFGILDDWQMFPVFNQDHKIIDIVVRSWKGKGDIRYVLHPDKDRTSPYLYCPDWSKIKDAQHYFIVYGLIDSWSLYSIGLPVITGTSGKSLSPNLLKPLNKYCTIIPDKYEEKDAYELAGQLGFKADVLRLKFPDGCKDPDEIRMMYGGEKLLELIGEQK